MAVYPATLPAPLARGYRLDPFDQTARTDMEMGAAKVRRRTAARDDQLALQWVLSDADMATFRAWFDDDVAGAAGGASWFTIDIKIGDGGSASKETRFIGPFQSEYDAGGLWAVSAKVEVR